MYKIKEGMHFDDWIEAWHAKCADKGHVLKEDRHGRIDDFVTNYPNHNGPGCVVCGWTACMHCDFEGKKIPDCKPKPQENPNHETDI